MDNNNVFADLDNELDAIEASTDAMGADQHPPILPPTKPNFCSNKLLHSPCECKYCINDKYFSAKSDIDYNSGKKLRDFDNNTINMIRNYQPNVYAILKDWDNEKDLPEAKPRGGGEVGDDSTGDENSDNMEVDDEVSEDEVMMEEGDVNQTSLSLVGTVVKVGGNGLPTIPSNIIPLLASPVNNLTAWDVPGNDYLNGLIIDHGDEYGLLGGGQKAALEIAHEIIKKCNDDGKKFLTVVKAKDVTGNYKYQECPPSNENLDVTGNKWKDDSLQCKIIRKILLFWGSGKSSGVGERLVERYKKELKQKKKSLEEHQQMLLSNENALGISNPNYTPASTKPSGNFSNNGGYSSAEWKQCEQELEIVRATRNQFDREMLAEVKSPKNNHKRTIDVVVENAPAYELLLEAQNELKKKGAVDFDKLGNDLEDRIGCDVVGSSARQEKWNRRSDEGKLCIIKSTMDRLLARQDYFSHRTTNLDNLQVFEMDHVQYYLNKLGKYKTNVSNIDNLRIHFLETLKCRVLHRGSHHRDGGHTDEYDNKLLAPQILMYGGTELGDEHRTITEVLDLKEVQRFIEDGKERKGFHGNAGIEALDICIWNNFGIDPEDVRGCTKDEYNADFSDYVLTRKYNDGGRKMRMQYRKKYWNNTLVRIMIKLSVECPNCGQCFRNIRRGRRQDVELHHLKKRDPGGKRFGDAGKLFVDDFVDVLKEGNADAWCVLCHTGESNEGR